MNSNLFLLIFIILGIVFIISKIISKKKDNVIKDYDSLNHEENKDFGRFIMGESGKPTTPSLSPRFPIHDFIDNDKPSYVDKLIEANKHLNENPISMFIENPSNPIGDMLIDAEEFVEKYEMLSVQQKLEFQKSLTVDELQLMNCLFDIVNKNR